MQRFSDLQRAILEQRREREGVWPDSDGEHPEVKLERAVVESARGVGMDEGGPENDVGVGDGGEDGGGEVEAVEDGVGPLELEASGWVAVKDVAAEEGGVDVEEVREGFGGFDVGQDQCVGRINEAKVMAGVAAAAVGGRGVVR